MTDLHVVVPAGFDDPANPSGGNVYDQRLCAGLTGLGWDVATHPVRGPWPFGHAESDLSQVLAALADGETVLVDGLVGGLVPWVMVPASRRLRLLLLVHLPFGLAAGDAESREAEAAVLSSAAAVVTTSAWTRDRLLTAYPLSEDLVRVARPGVDPAPLAAGPEDGTELLCVGAVTEHKGHDLLMPALAGVRDRPWRCTCVGPLDREPGYAAQVRSEVRASGIAGRVSFGGTLTGEALASAYHGASVLVVPSRFESYGMVALEALARGLPVIAFAVGGLPEAIGTTPEGDIPGLLVPPGDTAEMRSALIDWLGDGDLREALRRSALQRRTTLPSWNATVDAVAQAVDQVR